MSDTFDINRIKSIVEYNLRKHRIKGMDYKENGSTTDPSGIQGLENNDNEFTGWDQDIKEIDLENESRYAIIETNHNMRDFLAQTIQDILCDAVSDGSFSKSIQRIYNIKPSSGKSVQSSTKPIHFNKGNNHIRVKDDEIEILNGNNKIVISSDEVYIYAKNGSKKHTILTDNYGLRVTDSAIEISTDGGGSWQDLLNHTHKYDKADTPDSGGDTHTFTNTDSGNADYT
jgi:hypothetical protein